MTNKQFLLNPKIFYKASLMLVVKEHFTEPTKDSYVKVKTAAIRAVNYSAIDRDIFQTVCETARQALEGGK